MAMKASLQLKLGTQLTMTPQLQQAIRLLQLSTLDLQQEIQQALESNPMLEVAEEHESSQDAEHGVNSQSSDGLKVDSENAEHGDGADSETGADSGSDAYSDTGTDSDTGDYSERDAGSQTEDTRQEAASTPESWENEDWQNNSDIPDDLPVDTAWDDVYQSAPASSASRSEEDDGNDFETRNSVVETLQDHLLWQLNLTPLSDRDRVIAHTIIDAIDSNGYLVQTLEEIHQALAESDDEDPLEEDEVQAVLHRIQFFDPPGVGARDLQECLLIQLNQLPEDTPLLGQARRLVRHYLKLLGSRDYKQLMRRSRLTEDQLREVLALIQSLQPRPGDAINSAPPEYVVPDVIVSKHQGRWKVELNPDIAPRIQVNAMYASFIKRADTSADNTYMRDQLQEAKWFIKSLQSRNETLLKVATRIVEHQQAFLEEGDEAMKPLILSEIAQTVEMHESTISRVTTQKYMHTPRGIFELKYFFSSHVSTDSGGECSSTAIRAMIRKLIGEESSRKPLSDNKIAALLVDQGINVARRTVAKYREAMHIPPSNERKGL